MGATEESVVRRFYDELATGRKLELAEELIASDHELHDPQAPAERGPQGYAEVLRTYQENADGHWRLQEVLSAGDRVVVRWTGHGKHVGDLNGVPATGNALEVEGISVHRMSDGKIAETWQVWDTLSLLQQMGVVPEQG